MRKIFNPIRVILVEFSQGEAYSHMAFYGRNCVKHSVSYINFKASTDYRKKKYINVKIFRAFTTKKIKTLEFVKGVD